MPRLILDFKYQEDMDEFLHCINTCTFWSKDKSSLNFSVDPEDVEEKEENSVVYINTSNVEGDASCGETT